MTLLLDQILVMAHQMLLLSSFRVASSWGRRRVITAKGCSKQQEAYGHIPRARHVLVHLSELSCVRALRAALYRGTNTHLQGFKPFMLQSAQRSPFIDFAQGVLI